MTPRQKHEAAVKAAGFTALAEQHETIVRTEVGTTSIQSIDMVITQVSSEVAKSLGIDLQIEEACNLTLSLSALGYRPRVRGHFVVDNQKWFVKVAPPFGGADVVKLVLHRRTTA
jgi:hypothetical protein